MNIKKFNVVEEREWPKERPKNLVKVFRSSQFLVQQFNEENAIRLSVCSVKRREGNCKQGINWVQLQEIKRLVGFGNRYALEVYPEKSNMVKVSNMRHLLIPNERPSFAWKK